MSDRGEKRLVVLISAVVGALILALLLLLLRGPGEARVYRISVVMDGGAEEYWKLFRRGVDQAALDYSADVHFLSPAGEDPAAQQLELLAREIETGTDAIVIWPLDAAAVSRWMDENQVSCPVISVGCALQTTWQTAFVGAPSGSLGEALARAVLARESGVVWVLYDSTMPTASLERYRAFRSAAEGAGRTVRAVRREEATFTLLSAAERASEIAVVALDPESAEFAAAMVRQEALSWPVYGVGTTNLLIGELERGTVRALTVQSDYDVGYLAIGAAVSAIEEDAFSLPTPEIYIVDGYNMFKDDIARVLVPIS